MRRLSYLSVAGAFVALLWLLVIVPSKSGTLSVQTVYAPSPPATFDLPCGSGIISQWDYWPQQGDSTYSVKFKARAYAPTTLHLILPYGYEQELVLPADGLEYPYNLTVATPPYAGHDSLQIVFGADVARPCKGKDTRPGLIVRSINLQIGH